MMLSQKNTPYWILLGAALLATLLLGCLLQPMYLSFISDAVLQESFFTAFLYYFDTLLEELIFASLVILVAVGEYTFRGRCKPYVWSKIAVATVALCKYVCSLFATAADAGFDGLTPTDFEGLGLSFGLDILILVFVFLASFFAVRKHFARARILEKAYRQADKGPFDEKAEFFPFRRFISPKTPVLAGLFWGALGSLVLKIGSSLYYDLFFWGFPETAEDWAQMAQNYIGILLLAAVSYTFSYFAASAILKEKNRE